LQAEGKFGKKLQWVLGLQKHQFSSSLSAESINGFFLPKFLKYNPFFLTLVVNYNGIMKKGGNK